MKLSNREEQVYKLSKEGLSRREISDRTGLTMKSISNYRYNIKKKMKDLEREISREIDNYQDAQGKESFYTDTRGDSMSISSKSTRIKTVEQALEKAEVDLSI
ncbi:MAG: LuxR C-terminal-related transcriptional regulator [Nanoarchaeota archaeon]